MLGLLAVTQSACSDTTDQNMEGTGGIGGDETITTGGTSGDATGGASTGGTTAPGGSSNESSGSAGEGGVGGSDAVGVLSTKIIADLSLAEFTEMCDEAGGVVETHAQCGGVVTGPGFSYDSDTDAFTEHTCRGYNTCTGFSCVIDE